MTRTAWVLGAVSLLTATAAAAGHPQGTTVAQKDAVATVESRSGSKVAGTVVFTSTPGKVTMKVDLTGLTPGQHAIHLHEKGDCSDPEAKSAGPHWNPTNAQHGRWGEGSFHLGDIGNLVANAAGEATLTFTTDAWTVGDGAATDVVGRSVVVHDKVDDFHTQPTGNAGGRVGCGVIRVR
jgi:Cu-Zn family superoxide dismutase